MTGARQQYKTVPSAGPANEELDALERWPRAQHSIYDVEDDGPDADDEIDEDPSSAPLAPPKAYIASSSRNPLRVRA